MNALIALNNSQYRLSGFSPILVTIVTLNPSYLLDPAAVFCDPCVDTRSVPETAAISPTHNSSKEHAPIALNGSHWTTWVTLAGERRIYIHDIEKHKVMTCIWMWKKKDLSFHLTCIYASTQYTCTDHAWCNPIIHQLAAHSAVNNAHLGLLQHWCNIIWSREKTFYQLANNFRLLLHHNLYSITFSFSCKYFFSLSDLDNTTSFRQFSSFVLEFRHTWLTLCLSL